MSKDRTVIVFGKVGHGKTSLVNRLCEENFSSTMSATSCTRDINIGQTKKYGIQVLDTPGFYASDDVADHLAFQKGALEMTELSGIFLIVKLGRADEMAETLSSLMNFTGDEGIRVIVTFADTVSSEDGFDETLTKKRLSAQLEIPLKHIALFGKHSLRDEIEEFIYRSMYEPRQFRVTVIQAASVAPQSVGAKRFENDFKSLSNLMRTAVAFCAHVAHESTTSSLEVDTVLVEATRAEASRIVQHEFYQIREKAQRELSTLEEVKSVESKISGEMAQQLHALQNPNAPQSHSIQRSYVSLAPYRETQSYYKSNRSRLIESRVNITFSEKLESGWTVNISLDGQQGTIEEVRAKLCRAHQHPVSTSKRRNNTKTPQKAASSSKKAKSVVNEQKDKKSINARTDQSMEHMSSRPSLQPGQVVALEPQESRRKRKNETGKQALPCAMNINSLSQSSKDPAAQTSTKKMTQLRGPMMEGVTEDVNPWSSHKPTVHEKQQEGDGVSAPLLEQKSPTVSEKTIRTLHPLSIIQQGDNVHQNEDDNPSSIVMDDDVIQLCRCLGIYVITVVTSIAVAICAKNHM